MDILFFEAFGGGSHLTVAQGFQRHSRHTVKIKKLPPRHWRWRQRSSALALAEFLAQESTCDLLLTSSITDVCLLKSLVRKKCPPVLLYFHENQWDYPDQKRRQTPDKKDLHLAFSQLTSAFAAEGVAFNSRYQRDRFFSGSKDFLKKMPDSIPWSLWEKAREKSHILYPGLEPQEGPRAARNKEETPLLLWNHRWEHDKGPELLLQGLYHCRREALPFRLALTGERYSRIPEALNTLVHDFSREIISQDYLPQKDYVKLLQQADLVISTAYQENFGLALAEAVLAGALPLVPYRLSYPEILGAKEHPEIFYHRDEDFPQALANRLRWNLPKKPASLRRECISRRMKGYLWEKVISRWDQVCEATGGRDG